jgi:hypothetical protein
MGEYSVLIVRKVLSNKKFRVIRAEKIFETEGEEYVEEKFRDSGEKFFLGYAVGVNKELRVAALIGHHFKICFTVHKHMREMFCWK